MKPILTLLSATCLTAIAAAQCDFAVPANATVVEQDATITDGGNYWVCEGLTVEFSGFGPFVYVESDCNITVSGLLGVFYVKSGSTITVDGTNTNMVLEDGSTFIDNGTSNMSSPCADLVFDYTDAPAGGCSSTVGIVGDTKPGKALIFPNPAHQLLNIHLSGDHLLTAQLMDARGRVVRTASSVQDQLDLSGVEPGKYLLALRTTSGIEHKPVVVY